MPYSNDGPSGTWTGTQNDTSIQSYGGNSTTYSSVSDTAYPEPLSDYLYPIYGPAYGNGSGWADGKAPAGAVGTPPTVNVQPDPYWSNFFGALPGTIADTVSSDAAAVWSFVKSPDAAVAAAGFIPVVGNVVAAVNDFSKGHYIWGIVDVGFIALDEVGIGEGEAEARIAVSVGGDIEKAGEAAKEGTQALSAAETVERGAGLGTAEELAKGAEDGAPRTVSLTDQIIQNQCFIAGTQVVVAVVDSDGNTGAAEDALTAGGLVAVATRTVRYVTQSIEKIRRGELIVTRDQFDPEAPIVLRRVEEVFERIAHGLTIVTLRSSTGRLQTLHGTSEHPVYVPGRGWVVCRELEEGDKLVEPSGGISTVVSSRHERHRGGILVYNFQVEQSQTYFVREKGSLAEPVWVHNTCKFGPAKYSFSNSSRQVFPTAQNTWWQRAVRGAVGQGRQLIPTRIFSSVEDLRAAQAQWIARMAERGLGASQIEDRMRSALMSSGWRLGAGELPQFARRLLTEAFE